MKDNKSNFLTRGAFTEIIFGQVVADNNRHINRYRNTFNEQCRFYRDRFISDRFTLYATVYEGSFGYDLDIALKTILDCLKSVHAVIDINLCVGIVAEKRLDRRNPRVVFAIKEHGSKLFFVNNNKSTRR